MRKWGEEDLEKKGGKEGKRERRMRGEEGEKEEEELEPNIKKQVSME